MSATELLSAVLQLPIDDRRDLILKACASLDDDPLLDEIPNAFELTGRAALQRQGKLGVHLDDGPA